ncbi:MAG: cytidine deaminase [Nitrospiraceae bacterium]|nr:MAG: cytidine deaminase [Nitrospiraceae bacterium]
MKKADDDREVPAINQDWINSLVREAKKAMRNARAPYSAFRVGASLMTRTGDIYTGCNIENPSLMLSICAEKVALTKALSEGEKKFRAMAVVCEQQEYCFPCGSCRQIIREFAQDIDIFLIGKGGIRKYSLDELLPFPFSKHP